MPFVVQFPHPGGEHRPGPPQVGAVMPWNRGEHKRKFLRASARYLLDGHPQEGEVGFWGEWEAQSRVLEVWRKDGDLPRFLHEPFFEAPAKGVKHQNTDPFVFGESFLYTNCRQATNQKLRRLTPGSIVLFGSSPGAGFVLDTVFVVGDGEHPSFEIGERRVLPDRPEAEALVFRPLSTSEKHLGAGCRAYHGRPYAVELSAPFSFVPCRPLMDQVRFRRPLLEPVGALDGFITPTLRQQAKVTEIDDATAAAVWQQVRSVVEQQELALGVHLQVPASALGSDVPDDVPSDRGC
jgi:hypothetical protein